jgi:hypothetical protein
VVYGFEQLKIISDAVAQAPGQFNPLGDPAGYATQLTPYLSVLDNLIALSDGFEPAIPASHTFPCISAGTCSLQALIDSFANASTNLQTLKDHVTNISKKFENFIIFSCDSIILLTLFAVNGLNAGNSTTVTTETNAVLALINPSDSLSTNVQFFNAINDINYGSYPTPRLALSLLHPLQGYFLFLPP